MPVSRENEESDAGEACSGFARGMIGIFAVASYRLNASDAKCLRELKNARMQDACIRVYSQGYLAYTLNVGRFGDRVKGSWNACAARVNALFERQRGTNRNGLPIIQTREVLPTFDAIEPSLMGFVRSLEKQARETR